jgi:hypothetical protein
MKPLPVISATVVGAPTLDTSCGVEGGCITFADNGAVQVPVTVVNNFNMELTVMARLKGSPLNPRAGYVWSARKTPLTTVSFAFSMAPNGTGATPVLHRCAPLCCHASALSCSYSCAVCSDVGEAAGVVERCSRMTRLSGEFEASAVPLPGWVA